MSTTEYRKKYSPFFLHTDDEISLSTSLTTYIGDIVYIDGDRWPTKEPFIKKSITECTSNIVFLWSPKTVPVLPVLFRNGLFFGPTSGVVVQMIRSRVMGNFLLSGDIGIGYDKNNVELVQFVKSVWKGLNSLNYCSLRSVDRDNRTTINHIVKNYIVGRGAASFCNGSQILKHDCTENYYLPNAEDN